MAEDRFTLDVDGISRFVFRTRTMADTIRICAERAALLGDSAQMPDWLDAFAFAYATLKVLTEEASHGWDLDDMDPLDPKPYERAADVYRALRAQEHTQNLRKRTLQAMQAAADCRLPKCTRSAIYVHQNSSRRRL